MDDLAIADPASEELWISGDTRHIERLTEFRKLKSLCAWGVGAGQFEWICKLHWISTAVIHYPPPDLGPALGLTGVRTLMLLDNMKAESLAPLSGLTDLKVLLLEHWPKVRTLSPLASLTKLEGLCVQGGSNQLMEVESLEPLASLTELRELQLPRLKTHDKRLAPLANLKKLEYLQLPNFYPLEEFAHLAVALPNTEGNSLKPYWETSLKCTKLLCFKNLVLLTGDGTRHVCPRHDRRQLEDHVASFEAAKTSADRLADSAPGKEAAR